MAGNTSNGDVSDDSSSMGDGGYSSPSDLEDSDEEGVSRKRGTNSDSLFTHRPHKFVKAKIDKAPSSPIRRGRKKKANNSTIQKNKLLLLERQRQVRLQQQKKRGRSFLDSSDEDSDSDSDIEVLSKIPTADSKTNPRTNPAFGSRRKPQKVEEPKSELLELLSSGESSPESSTSKTRCDSVAAFTTTNAISAASRFTRTTAYSTAATQAISCLSSDEEEDDDFMSSTLPKLPLNLPPALAASLRQAREAKARLEQAQEYHAHDVHVAVEETLLVPTRASNLLSSSKPANIAISMGKPLSFTCRCAHLVMKGIKEAVAKDQQSTVLTVREREPLSALVGKFCRAHSLPQNKAKIVLNFDGQYLDVNKTPTFYKMEDEDLIDVAASAPFRSKEQQQRPNPLAKASTLLGHKRSSRGKSLEFSCRTKITEVDSAPKARGRRPKKMQPTAKPTIITKSIGLCENENLGVLSRRLCASLGDLSPLITKVVMRFDGNVLDMEKTPKFYEMEDEDMIEVSIEKQQQQKLPATKKSKSSPHPLQLSRPLRATRSSSRSAKKV